MSEMTRPTVSRSGANIVAANWQEDDESKHDYFHEVDFETGNVLLIQYTEWEKEGKYWARTGRGYSLYHDGGIAGMTAKEVRIPKHVKDAILEEAKTWKKEVEDSDD